MYVPYITYIVVKRIQQCLSIWRKPPGSTIELEYTEFIHAIWKERNTRVFEKNEAAMEDIARRVQLIKSVIFEVQAYWAQVFLLPKKVIKAIEQTCRTFLWTWTVTMSRNVLLSWETICEPHATGGLNIIVLKAMEQGSNTLTIVECSEKGLSLHPMGHGYFIKRRKLETVLISTSASWVVRKILGSGDVFLQRQTGQGALMAEFAKVQRGGREVLYSTQKMYTYLTTTSTSGSNKIRMQDVQRHLHKLVTEIISLFKSEFKTYRLDNIRNIFVACLILFLALPSSHSLKDSTMGNIINKSSNQDDANVLLPIDTPFRFPSPLPTWPSGQGFASGVIDLGGLQVSQISSFTKVWASQEGGPDDLGVTFFEPSNLPNGFFMLGSYSQPNNLPLFGWLLVGKDSSGDALKLPTDYTLVWSSENLKIKQDSVCYIWLPIPPEGYKSVGHVVTTSPQKPSLDKIRCVRSDLTDVPESDDWIWGNDGLNVYSSRPKDRGIRGLGVSTGAFVALNNGASADSLACLKNVKENSSSMPNLNQVQALFQAYSPLYYFHPDEQYYPSSVTWFFQNGILLYTKGQESAPVLVQPDGSNLPQDGSNDGAYWLDLPTDDSAKDRVKNGDFQAATAYLHIKPMFGATHTDIALWLFYPFNGPARAKIEFITIPLGKIGQHVGDWEHVTLRISNFNGELQGVYFSQHSGGNWVSAPQLEFENGNKPVAYSSLHGHACYSKTGQNMLGSGNIGIRNDTAKGQVMDTGANYSVVAGDYLKIVEPAWLNYAREWGPKISYDIGNELKKIERFLPGKLKKAIEKLLKSLPNEVLGEEGPTGPKFKDMWYGDERG